MAEVVIEEVNRVHDLSTSEGRAAFKLANNVLHPSDWADKPMPPVVYLIDGLIDEGSLVMLAAEEGTGKSIVSTHMAHQVAIGGRFLGKECTRTPVVYYVLDEPQANIMRRLQRQGIKAETNFLLFSELSADENTTERFLRSLELKIEYARREYGRVPMVFLDTMADALDIEELNNHSEVVNKLGQLRELIR